MEKRKKILYLQKNKTTILSQSVQSSHLDFKNRVIFPKMLQIQIFSSCHKLMNRKFMTQKSNCPTKSLKITWVCPITNQKN